MFKQQKGTYHVEASKQGTCRQASGNVVAKFTDFTATITNQDTTMIMPWDTVTLNTSTSAVSPTYQWFKDGVAINGATSATLIATDKGVYYAEITQNNGCISTKATKNITIKHPDQFTVTIGTISSYNSCQSTQATIGVTEIRYWYEGNINPINPTNYNQFSYSWTNNGTAIPSATTTNYTIGSDIENGTYQLTIAVAGLTATSNTLTIQLATSNPIAILGSTTLALCTGTNHTLEADINDSSLTYTWYKDNNQVANGAGLYTYTIDTNSPSASGTYYVTVTKPNFCTQTSAPVTANFESFSASLSPNADTLLMPWESVTITALTNASNPSYAWYQNGQLINGVTAATLTVSQPGNYYAIVTENTSCNANVTTETISVSHPQTFTLTIGETSTYTACTSTDINLGVVELRASIADGTSVIVPVSEYIYFSKEWQKDNTTVNGQTAASISLNTENENGNYQLIFKLNSYTAISNSFNVQLANSQILSIIGNDNVILCPQSSYTLEASIQDNTKTYTWFKDNVQVSSGIAQYTYNITEAGTYYVTTNKSGFCSQTSQTITVSENSLFANLVNTEEVMILPYQTTDINVTTNMNNPTYVWYKDNVLLAGETGATLTVNAPGTYHAVVSQNNGCTYSATTETKTVLFPDEITATIAIQGTFSSCDSTNATLSIATLTAETYSGIVQTIPITDYIHYNFSWLNSGIPISGETNYTITIPSTNPTGTYELRVMLGTLLAFSNTIDITFVSIEDVTISSPDTVLCDNSTILLSSSTNLPEYTYQWYRNGTAIVNSNMPTYSVTQDGSYLLEISYNGCVKQSNTITIVPVNEDLITLDSPKTINIPEGYTKVVTASGGDSYLWMDPNGTVISSSNSATLSLEGIYTLIATVGSCDIVMEITVRYQVSLVIPNVISPNMDGFNDQWVIPVEYAYNEDVEVYIFTQKGEVLLKTNAYQNNWPEVPLTNTGKGNTPVYFYKLIRNNMVLKQGTITIVN